MHMMGTGNWELGTGNWKLGTGNWENLTGPSISCPGKFACGKLLFESLSYFIVVEDSCINIDLSDR